MPTLRCGRLGALALMWAAAAYASSAGAATITWAKKGEFETCLESTLDTWLTARAAIEVNDAPTAAKLDDAAVAAWTLQTMAQCRSRGGKGEAASEERFTKYMAHWRQHIYDLAADIRKRGETD